MYWPDSTAATTAALTSSSTGGRESGIAMGRRLLVVDAAVLAAVVEQRMEAIVAAGVSRLDAAHEDRVIARGIRVHDGALELGEGILEHGHAERAHPVAHGLELLRRMRAGPGREACGDRLLVVGEDVDGEARAVGQGPIALRVVSDADQDQGRV